VKKILVIVMAVILVLSLSLTSVTFAARGKNEVTLAQEAGQAWLDSKVALTDESLGWLGADLAAPQICYGLDGRPNAYMFSIENSGEVVGYIIVGSSAYGYPVFEAGDGAPPSIPSAENVKSTLQRDLGLKVEKIGKPTSLLLLGFDNIFAVYQAGEQEVAVDLKFNSAMPASRLTAIDNMPSPEVYKANVEATEQSKPEVLASFTSTAESTTGDMYNELTMSRWCRGCYDDYGCNPPLSDGKKVCWCAPTSGVIIGHYYKYQRGYSHLPSSCNLYCELFNEMDTSETTGNTYIWNYGPGFVDMAEDHNYNNFHYYTVYFPSSDFYWNIVDYINWGYPTAMVATKFYEDVGDPPADNWPPKKGHYVVIKGYQSPYGSYEHVVLCVDAGHQILYLNWDYIGLFRCTCTIWTG